MNKMRIPKILRALTWISIPIFVISLAGLLLLPSPNEANFPDWLKAPYPALEILVGLSFVLMLTAYSFSLVFDWALNGLLRRFGKPATAAIIARHNTGISTGRVSHIWRIKLRVQPVDGEAFEAITEDQGSGGEVGEQVSVSYDPLTKSVAIGRPWDEHQHKSKDEKF
jgi:hypothetical protein